MKYGLLSDIHSNLPALEAVLADLRAEGVDGVILLGDVFGYYPWAVEVYDLLRPLHARAIRGNHDVLLLRTEPPMGKPAAYWPMARHNAGELNRRRPEALAWIASLSSRAAWDEGGLKITLCHGTPEDPEEGRLYPDDSREYPWLPRAGEVLALGHTHYPISRVTAAGGLLVNPGSVGQPRDGDPRPSWAVLDTGLLSVEQRRTPYEFRAAMGALEALGWDRRSVLALAKDYTGPLRVPGERS